MSIVFGSFMSSHRPRALRGLATASLAMLFATVWANTTASMGGPGLRATHDADVRARPLPSQLPALDVPFVENAGELDGRVALYAATSSGTLFVTHDGELTYVLPAGKATGEAGKASRWVLKEHLVGAHQLQVSGAEPTPMTVRHMGEAVAQGNDSSRSAARQATYRWADLGEAWPGVTVRIRASDARAEQYFRVAPGAEAARVRLSIDGARRLSTNARGELEVATAANTATALFSTPVAWQEIDGQRQPVAVRYALHGTREYGFVLGRHDRARAVVIDPLLQSTYIGGSGGSSPTDGVADLAIEPSTGDVYVVGYTATTTGFPVSAGALQPTHAAQIAVFVARLPADLKSFTEVTYLGGTKDSLGNTIAISPLTGDIYVAGTSQGSFPGTAGGAFTACGSFSCAFISRMDSTLSTLRQTTTYGDNVDSGYPVRLALDATSGDVYLAGSSSNAALQGTAGGAQPTYSGPGTVGFVARFAADLKTLKQATYIEGSSGQQRLRGLGIEPTSGDIFVAGWSTSATLPATAGAFQTSPDPNGGDTGFVARLPKTLTSLVALSYLSAANSNGGSGSTGGKLNAPITFAESLALHPVNGDLYVSGTTFQGNVLPASTGGYQSTFPVGDNAQFVVRLAPDLSSVRQSTFLIDLNNGPAGASSSRNKLIRIPAAGDVFILGEACPGTSGGAQSTFPPGGPAGVPCLSRLTPDLHTLLQSTYLSGSGPLGGGFLFEDVSGSYAIMAIRDSNGDVYVGGATESIDFPGTAGGAEPVAPGATSSGVISGYIARLSADLAATAQPGTLQFSAATYTAADTSGNATITVTRTGGGSGAVSVSFATSDGTGKAGTDYTTTTQTVSFAAGDTAAKTVSVPVKVNGTMAGNETVNLTLSGPTGGATQGSPATAVLTITQTTAPSVGALQFSAGTYSAADTAGSATITVTRTGGSNGAVSASFATSDGTGKAGTDYTTTSQTVSFAAGDTAAKTVSVPVKVNGTVAGDETVNLTLSGSTGGATLGSPATAVLTITQTTAPAPSPPTTTRVTVVGKGGGGATRPIELALLGLLALARLIRWRSRQPATRANPALRAAALRTAILAGALGASASAIADSPYYVGASLGQTRSEASSTDLTQKLAAAGFPGATVALDDHKLGVKIFVGRSFGDHFAIEGAYVDLGTVRSRSSVATAPANEAAFVQAVANAHPYSARGVDVTALAGFRPVSRVSLYARAGGFAWRGKIDAALPGLSAASNRKDGLSGVLGAGVGVDLTSHFALRIEWERYFVTRYSADLASVGVRFGF
jgi:Calx-beta domain/OmpA-like transmembrane domain